MLLDKIKSHNYLNGLVFSAVEFFLAALVVAPFFIYYITHEKLPYATVSAGLIINFLTITFVALQSLYKKEANLGLSFYFHKEKRRAVSKNYPHLGRDTIVLCIGFLVPYCLFLVVLCESLLSRTKTHS